MDEDTLFLDSNFINLQSNYKNVGWKQLSVMVLVLVFVSKANKSNFEAQNFFLT